MSPRKTRLAFSSVLIIVLVLLGLILFSFLQNRKLTATLVLEVAPTGSAIEISGENADEGNNKVEPGSYTITFNRDGFSDFSRSIDVKKDESIYVGAVLIPTDTRYRNWYSNHPEDAKKAEGISSKNSDQGGKSQLSSFPFLKSLPWVMPSYRVDYGVSQKYKNDPSKFAIYITHDSEAAKQRALDWLKEKGADASSLEIVFTKTEPARNLNP